MKRVPRFPILQAIISISAAAAFAGSPTISSSEAGQVSVYTPGSERRSPVSEASSYFGYSISQLKLTIPGLNGLKYDPVQTSLPEILHHLSDVIDSMLPRLPNLISRETVIHFQGARDSLAPNNPAAAQLWSREFRYLLSAQIDASGNTTIHEVRTDSKGRVANSMGALSGLRGYGFANQWLFFSSANQSQFRFRYLGHQRKTGYLTYVVAFSQEPGKVDDPAYFTADGKSAAFYYQGILWIDESTFNIVALRTDLLAPLPALHLLQFSTDVTFSLVKIPGLAFTM